jgi:hypothetical protein
LFDAGHSFLTDGEQRWWTPIVPLMNLGDYPEARENGWQKIFAFFDKHLG